MDTIQLIPGNSLLTATPEEGRQLAVKMARLIIKLKLGINHKLHS